MIEIFDNLLQLTVLGACITVSLVKYFRTHSRYHMLITLFYAEFFLGDLYWVLYYSFFGITPHIFFVTEMSWYVSYLFLYLFLLYELPLGRHDRKYGLQLVIPFFSAGLGLFYVLSTGDEIVSNVIAAVTTCLLATRALRILLSNGKDAAGPALTVQHRFLKAVNTICILALALFFCEHAMWTFSISWSGTNIENAYYWFDFGLTVVFCLLLPAFGRVYELRKVVNGIH